MPVLTHLSGSAFSVDAISTFKRVQGMQITCKLPRAICHLAPHYTYLDQLLQAPACLHMPGIARALLHKVQQTWDPGPQYAEQKMSRIKKHIVKLYENYILCVPEHQQNFTVIYHPLDVTFSLPLVFLILNKDLFLEIKNIQQAYCIFIFIGTLNKKSPTSSDQLVQYPVCHGGLPKARVVN